MILISILQLITVTNMSTISSYITIALFALSALFWSSCDEETIEPTLFGNVIGEVLASEDNAPIEQATVSTNPATSTVFTDASGNFELGDIPVGTYSLRAEKNGFLTEVASVTVFDEQESNVIVRLDIDSLENAPPSLSTLVAPMDGAIDLNVDVELVWTATDEDQDDVLSYDVTLFTLDTTQSRIIVSGSTDTSFQLTDLEYNTNYFWQVTVNDGANDPVLGPVWGFKTQEFPDHRFLFARSINGKFDIYSADGLGTEIQLSSLNGSSWRPRMNPQRDRIAFISNENIQPQLYVMDRDGNNVKMITTLPISGADQFELDFTWSPDGTKILYMANTRLYTINPDGTGLEAFTQAPQGFTFAEADWTAQGDFIVARIVGTDYYRSLITIIDNQGAFGQFLFTDIQGATGGPNISIPGTDILYTHDVSGFESQDERQLDARIFERNIQTLATVDLSFEKINGTNDLDAIYSPDGSKIMFTNSNNDGISIKNILLMDLDGLNREVLFENAEMGEWR